MELFKRIKPGDLRIRGNGDGHFQVQQYRTFSYSYGNYWHNVGDVCLTTDEASERLAKAFEEEKARRRRTTWETVVTRRVK